MNIPDFELSQRGLNAVWFGNEQQGIMERFTRKVLKALANAMNTPASRDDNRRLWTTYVSYFQRLRYFAEKNI